METEYSHAKKERNWTSLLHYSLKLTKINERLRCKTRNHKNHWKKTEKLLLDMGLDNDFLDMNLRQKQQNKNKASDTVSN